jgi:hypothetical protein
MKKLKSDKARATPGARRRPKKLQKLVARTNYEPPKVISFPTSGMTKLKPVTMMANT